MPPPSITRAISEHYLERFPKAVYDGVLLMFPVQLVVVAFDDNDCLTILDKHYSPERAELLIKQMAHPTVSTVDKVNKRRGFLYLKKGSRVRRVEYCNPAVFDLLDEALGGQAISAS